MDDKVDILNYAQKFNDSYERIFSNENWNNGNVDKFFEDFYQNFVKRSVEVSRVFEFTDLARRKHMMKASLIFLVSVIGDVGASRAIEKLAKDHSSALRNIRHSLYDDWLESLIETAQKYDPLFDRGSERSWRLAMSKGIAYMKR